MRKLLIMRGLSGCGKSTWIKNHNLEDYTLSSDKLRMMYSAPSLGIYENNESIDSSFVINNKFNSTVWKSLYNILENRMKEGCFTVVDAMHLSSQSLTKYKKLAKKYRYRLGVVDFIDKISIEDIIAQNKNRLNGSNKKADVPSSVIMDKMKNSVELIPSGFTIINPFDEEEIDNFISIKPLDMTKDYKKIVFIGDIHGCYSALNKYIKQNNGINKDDGNYYIFIGDYFDRGVENSEVFNFLNKIKNYKNTLLLEGNHESHLIKYSRDEKLNEELDFFKKTLPEFKQSGILERDIKNFTHYIAQIAYIKCNNKTFLASHAGISNIDNLSKLTFVNTKDFITGTGYYPDVLKVADNWNINNKEKNIYQVFGHRNYFNSPMRLNDTCFCLENHVEKLLDSTGTLRVLEYDIAKDDFNELEFSNPKWDFGYEGVNNPKVKFVIDKMRKKPSIISERKLDDNISSFNFTKTAFFTSHWDSMTTKARGLFIDVDTNSVVARSYNKFFNLNENKETTLNVLNKRLSFPVVAYKKENGFLGILSAVNHQLYFCSKSLNSTYSIPDNYAKIFEDVFRKTILPDGISGNKTICLIDYLEHNNVSMVFECIDIEKDPHIIKYKESKVVLLDIIKNSIDFSLFSNYVSLKVVAEAFNMDYKEESHVFNNWNELSSFLINERNKSLINDFKDEKEIIEGYVFKDGKNYMFKFKSNYYLFWKMVRGMLYASQLYPKPYFFKQDRKEFSEPIKNEMFNIYTNFRNFLIKEKGYSESAPNTDFTNANIIKFRDDFYQK